MDSVFAYLRVPLPSCVAAVLSERYRVPAVVYKGEYARRRRLNTQQILLRPISIVINTSRIVEISVIVTRAGGQASKKGKRG